MSADELFELVDESGAVIGRAPRGLCHGNPGLLHQAVHVLVFNAAGELFLQRRSLAKDVQPGRWDTSVGGHMAPREKPLESALREAREELGLDGVPLEFSHEYLWRTAVETEYVRTYTARCEGPFTLDPGEIEEGRFWSFAEIAAQLGTGVFTPNFEWEFERLRAARAGG